MTADVSMCGQQRARHVSELHVDLGASGSLTALSPGLHLLTQTGAGPPMERLPSVLLPHPLA